MQNNFQRRRFIGSDDEASGIAPLFEKLEHGDTLIVSKLDRRAAGCASS
jgi:DNA invertase Pin-like site-specific DNA recombinase